MPAGLQAALLAAAVTVAAAMAAALGRAIGGTTDRRRALARAAAVVLIGGSMIVQPGGWLLSSAAVIAAGVALGQYVGSGLRSVGALLTFLAVVAVVDILSFSGGLTAAVIEGHRAGRPWLRLLSVSVPVGDRVVPVVGVGDLVMAAAVSQSLTIAGAGRAETVLVPAVGLLAAAVVGLTVGGVFALPFLAAAVAGWAVVGRRSATISNRGSKTEQPFDRQG